MQPLQLNPPETSFRPSKAEWERLLNRVVESTPFRRSARLRDFLIYVGNEVVLRAAEDLPEQQIGVAVFGRSPSYDTSQDNIVRVNAMELRKRIDLYFANEGQNEPLVFEIPRGSYSPVFRVRQTRSEEHPHEDAAFVEEALAPGTLPGQESLESAVGQKSHPAQSALRNPYRSFSLWLSFVSQPV